MENTTSKIRFLSHSLTANPSPTKRQQWGRHKNQGARGVEASNRGGEEEGKRPSPSLPNTVPNAVFPTTVVGRMNLRWPLPHKKDSMHLKL